MGEAIDDEWPRVRPDFVPAEHYISPAFLAREADRLWPRVWQVACREEELAAVGAFVTYDIMHDSIVVVRSSENAIKAFYNVCRHRGRRLTQGCGRVQQFQCRFHGWRYTLDGDISRVIDRQDWDDCGGLADADLHLKELQVGAWGGFVFVNPDPDAEPLESFLGEVPAYLDPFELQAMRYRWHASVRTPCNWKTAVDAFNEAYHVFGTHSQIMLIYGDDTTRNRSFGRHSMFYYPGNPAFPMGTPSPRLGQEPPTDIRANIVRYYEEFDRSLRAIFTERDAEAVRRLLTELPETAGPYEVLGKMMEVQREAAIACGAGWPDMTMEQMMAAGTDWHIFPNLVILPYPTGALAYRFLPDARDPDFCFLEIYSLQRYAPGSEPPLERQYLHGPEDYRRVGRLSTFLQQDFDNMGEVQRGMRSRGFDGGRANPLQEATVTNFHRSLREFMAGG